MVKNGQDHEKNPLTGVARKGGLRAGIPAKVTKKAVQGTDFGAGSPRLMRQSTLHDCFSPVSNVSGRAPGTAAGAATSPGPDAPHPRSQHGAVLAFPDAFVSGNENLTLDHPGGSPALRTATKARRRVNVTSPPKSSQRDAATGDHHLKSIGPECAHAVAEPNSSDVPRSADPVLDAPSSSGGGCGVGRSAAVQGCRMNKTRNTPGAPAALNRSAAFAASDAGREGARKQRTHQPERQQRQQGQRRRQEQQDERDATGDEQDGGPSPAQAGLRQVPGRGQQGQHQQEAEAKETDDEEEERSATGDLRRHMLLWQLPGDSSNTDEEDRPQKSQQPRRQPGVQRGLFQNAPAPVQPDGKKRQEPQGRQRKGAAGVRRGGRPPVSESTSDESAGSDSSEDSQSGSSSDGDDGGDRCSTQEDGRVSGGRSSDGASSSSSSSGGSEDDFDAEDGEPARGRRRVHAADEQAGPSGAAAAAAGAGGGSGGAGDGGQRLKRKAALAALEQMAGQRLMAGRIVPKPDLTAAAGTGKGGRGTQPATRRGHPHARGGTTAGRGPSRTGNTAEHQHGGGDGDDHEDEVGADAVAAAAEEDTSSMAVSEDEAGSEQQGPLAPQTLAPPAWKADRPGYAHVREAVAYRQQCEREGVTHAEGLPRCWGSGLLDDCVVLGNTVMRGDAGSLFRAVLDAARKNKKLWESQPLVTLVASDLTDDQAKRVRNQLGAQLRAGALQRMRAEGAEVKKASCGRHVVTNKEVLDYFPEVLPLNGKVEWCRIGDGSPWDDVSELHGQMSLRAKEVCALEPGELLGPYSSEGWLYPEWEEVGSADPSQEWDDREHPCPWPYMLQRKHAFGRYAADCDVPDTVLAAHPALDLPDHLRRQLESMYNGADSRLYLTSARLGCELSYVNDPRRNLNPRHGEDKDHREGGPNVLVVTAVVLGLVPINVMVAKKRVEGLEHLKYDYEDAYWHLHREETAAVRDLGRVLERLRLQQEGRQRAERQLQVEVRRRQEAEARPRQVEQMEGQGERCRQLEAEVSRLRGQLEAQGREAEKKHREVMAQAAQVREEAARQRQAEERQLLAEQAERRAEAERRQQQEAEVARLHSEAEEHRQALEAAQQRLQQQQQQLQQQRLQADAAERCRELEVELSRLRVQQHTAKMERVRDLEEEVGRLMAELGEQRLEAERCREVEAQVAELQEEVATQRAESERLRGMLAKRAEKVRDAQERWRGAKVRNAFLRVKIHGLRAQLQALGAARETEEVEEVEEEVEVEEADDDDEEQSPAASPLPASAAAAAAAAPKHPQRHAGQGRRGNAASPQQAPRRQQQQQQGTGSVRGRPTQQATPGAPARGATPQRQPQAAAAASQGGPSSPARAVGPASGPLGSPLGKRAREAREAGVQSQAAPRAAGEAREFPPAIRPATGVARPRQQAAETATAAAPPPARARALQIDNDDGDPMIRAPDVVVSPPAYPRRGSNGSGAGGSGSGRQGEAGATGAAAGGGCAGAAGGGSGRLQQQQHGGRSGTSTPTDTPPRVSRLSLRHQQGLQQQRRRTAESVAAAAAAVQGAADGQSPRDGDGVGVPGTGYKGTGEAGLPPPSAAERGAGRDAAVVGTAAGAGHGRGPVASPLAAAPAAAAVQPVQGRQPANGRRSGQQQQQGLGGSAGARQHPATPVGTVGRQGGGVGAGAPTPPARGPAAAPPVPIVIDSDEEGEEVAARRAPPPPTTGGKRVPVVDLVGMIDSD